MSEGPNLPWKDFLGCGQASHPRWTILVGSSCLRAASIEPPYTHSREHIARAQLVFQHARRVHCQQHNEHDREQVMCGPRRYILNLTRHDAGGCARESA